MTRPTLVLLAGTLFAACSGSSSSASSGGAEGGAVACARADPSCTSPTPSYAADIKDILAANCVTCHYPESTLAQSSLASYDAVHLVFGSALGQVSSCQMPPAGEPPLTAEERQALLTWLACGAPDN